MRLTVLIAMMLIGLSIGTTVEARTLGVTIHRPLGMTIERPLYGLPFNRPPQYRRGPRPPAIREHERYYRPGKKRSVHAPFERSRYLMLPRRKPPHIR